MLHRQPAIVAILHVGVDAEPELPHVERHRFVLVAHVHTGNLDTLAHRTSFVLRRTFLPRSIRRRFSETAMVRCGRWAPPRMQSGARPGSRAVTRPRLRKPPGFSPVMSLKVRE